MGKWFFKLLSVSIALFATVHSVARDADDSASSTVVYRVGANNLFANVGFGDYYGKFKQYGVEKNDDYDSDWSRMERYTINIGFAYNF